MPIRKVEIIDFTDNTRKIIRCKIKQEGKDDKIEEYDFISGQEIIEKITRNEPIIYDHVYIEEINLQNDSNNFESAPKGYTLINSEIHITNSICGNLEFFGCYFKNTINFNSTIFQNNISIIHNQFKDDVIFLEVDINGSIRFDNLTFNNELYLSNIQIQGQFRISSVNFNQLTNFINVRFYQEIESIDVNYNGITYFTSCKFYDKCDFSGNKFDEFYFTANTLDFKNKKSDKPVIFSGSIFNKLAGFNNLSLFENIYFDAISVKGKIIFSNLINPDRKIISFKAIKKSESYNGQIEFVDTDLSQCSFLFSDMSLFDFTQNVIWGEKGNRIVLWDEEEIKTKSKNEKKKLYRHLETLYRQLKCKHLDLKDYKTADAFMASEYEISRRSHRFPLLSWEIAYKLFSNYGMNWWLPICWFIFSLFIVSSITIYYIESIHNYTIDDSGTIFRNYSFWEILSYNFFSTIFLKQELVKVSQLSSLWISHICGAFNVAMFLLSGFAIKRKFRT